MSITPRSIAVSNPPQWDDTSGNPDASLLPPSRTHQSEETLDLTDVPLDQESVYTLEPAGDTGSTAPLIHPEQEPRGFEALEVQDLEACPSGSIQSRARSCVNSNVCRNILAGTVTTVLFGGVGAAWVYSKANQAEDPPP
jgi:hypothetical protein